MHEEIKYSDKKITYSKKYVIYSTFILGLINLIDVFTTDASPLVASFVVEEFLISQGIPENIAYSQYGIIFSIVPLLGFLTLFVKFIADRWGRKPALLINIMGMTIGALIVIISQTFWVFVLGRLIGTLFLVADIQLLLVNEECPKEKRATYFAFVKIIGQVGSILVLLMRAIFITVESTNWRAVFLLPFIGGIVTSIAVLFTFRESSVYLTMKARNMASSDYKPEKLSLIKAIKALFKLKNFRIVLISSLIGFIVVASGMFILQYWEPFLSTHFTSNEVNIIYLINVLVNLFLAYLVGFINDKIGRKKGLLLTMIITPLFIVLCLFLIPIKNLLAIGLTFGLFISAIWASNNTLSIVKNELTPTKYRGTMKLFMGFLFIIFSTIFLFVFSYLVIFLSFEIIFLLVTISGSIIGIIIIIKIIPETKATDLTTVE